MPTPTKTIIKSEDRYKTTVVKVFTDGSGWIAEVERPAINGGKDAKPLTWRYHVGSISKLLEAA